LDGITDVAVAVVDIAITTKEEVGAAGVIRINSELKNSIKGEDFAKELFEQGYKMVFLATGHSANDFRSAWWLSGIVGKRPPW